MRIEVPTTDAEAERLRTWRERFQEGADYVRQNPPPGDIVAEIWDAQAEACECMVEEMDAALAAFAVTCAKTK